MYWYLVLIPASVFTLSNASSFLFRKTAGLMSVKILACIPDLVEGLDSCFVRNSTTDDESLTSM